MKAELLLLSSTLLGSSCSLHATKLPDAPHDLSRWSAVCYCTMDHGTNPESILRADDNGQILYEARQGKNRSQLEAALGHPVTTSQLLLLVDWRLLRVEHGVYTTAIPVLEPEKMLSLRSRLREQVRQQMPQLLPNALHLKQAMIARGWQDHLYTLLFSYVLDNLVWKQLDTQKLVTPLQTSREHPFWDGSLWVYLPERANTPGTNTYTVGDTELPEFSMLWTKAVLSQVVTLENSPALDAILPRLSREDCRNLRMEDLTHHTWNFGRPDGSCAIPVLHPHPDDAIYAASMVLARQVALEIASADLTPLTQEGISASDARILLAHEWIWSVLDVLEEMKIVSRPGILQNQLEAEDTTPYLPLVFVRSDR